MSSTTSSSSSSQKSPFLLALMANQVQAVVIDMDHYRIHGGMAVETDYIIVVEPTPVKEGELRHDFDTFTISKTYSSFRSMAHTLDKLVDKTMSNKYSFSIASTSKRKKLPSNVVQTAKHFDHVIELIESQKTQYLGKVNYKYVKIKAKQRKHILNDTLDAMLSRFPNDIDSHTFLGEVASVVETFFLTDHVEMANPPIPSPTKRQGSGSHFSSAGEAVSNKSGVSEPKKTQQQQKKPGVSPSGLTVQTDPSKTASTIASTGNTPATAPASMNRRGKFTASVVEAKTYKVRRDESQRAIEVDDLENIGKGATLTVGDNGKQTDSLKSTSTYQSSPGNKISAMLEANPLMFVGILLASVLFLHIAKEMSVTLDVDLALLVLFASFCMGLHTPRSLPPGAVIAPPSGPTATDKTVSTERTRRADRAGARLLRQSMIMTSPTSGRRASIQALKQQKDLLSAVKEASADIEEEETEPTQIKKDDTAILDEFDDVLDEEEDDALLAGPMEKFPEGAKLGSHTNCYSDPDVEDFSVRGPNYLSDKKKIASGPFLFPCRGVDLFLTDATPENVGSNSSVFGGRLREAPTFIVNFRLPWGVFVAYFEIPSNLVPYLKAGYDDPTVDKDDLMQKMAGLTPGQRTAARFLMGDDAHRNHTLKIVPRVVQGPWVVKSVVGGKPAIIGNKLPVNWVYQPEEKFADNKTKALYLEADLDIVSSSAARGILSVTRQYTQILTIDLGFVIQGNQEDELPEQMLVGARLHGIDPVTAPPLPPMKNDALFFHHSEGTFDEDD